MTSVSLDVTGRMLLGTDVAAVLAILEVAPRRRHRVQLLDRPGAHARTDPLHHVAHRAAGRVHPQRRVCRSTSTVARTTRSKPVPMATELASFVSEYGVSIVGGCCGSTPEHIRELVARVGAASRAHA